MFRYELFFPNEKRGIHINNITSKNIKSSFDLYASGVHFKKNCSELAVASQIKLLKIASGLSAVTRLRRIIPVDRI